MSFLRSTSLDSAELSACGGRVGEGAIPPSGMTSLSPRQTGRADFPHPAFTQTLAVRQYVSLKPT